MSDTDQRNYVLKSCDLTYMEIVTSDIAYQIIANQ